MKAALIEELAGTWEVMAETEDGSNPARRATLREAADTLRMLVASQDTAPPAAVPAPDSDTVQVCKEDANNYCRILAALDMEEEGDPVAEVERLIAQAAAPAQAVDAPVLGDDLNWLLSDMDGQKWADEFCKRNPSMDHGLMLGWFCCAIMTGFDEANRRRDMEGAAGTAQAVDSIGVMQRALLVIEGRMCNDCSDEICCMPHSRASRDELRAALAAQPAAPAGEPVAWLESEESARKTPIKEIMRGMFHTAVWHFSERPQTSNPVWTLHAPVANTSQKVASSGGKVASEHATLGAAPLPQQVAQTEAKPFPTSRGTYGKMTPEQKQRLDADLDQLGQRIDEHRRSRDRRTHSEVVEFDRRRKDRRQRSED